MKGLIVINSYYYIDSSKNQVSRLIEEFKKKNVEIKVVSNSMIPCFINGDKLESKIDSSIDFVIYLDKDKYYLEMLESKGIKVFNSSKAVELCDDKMLTHLALVNHGIKMPKTVVAPLCYFDETNDTFLQNLLKEFTFPIVVKENFGSLGHQVYLVNNIEELRKMELKLKNKPHIYQEFIKSSCGQDYRFIIIGNKIIATMKRISHQDFRSNVALGGSTKKVNAPEAFNKVALKAARILKLDYCGIDIMIGLNNEPILCEVNSNAFFQGIEETCHINVAGKYVDYVISQIEKANKKGVL